MKVKCINPKRAKAALTKDKEYLVESSSHLFYRIKDDKCQRKDILKKRFKVVRDKKEINDGRMMAKCIDSTSTQLENGRFYKVKRSVWSDMWTIIDNGKEDTPYFKWRFEKPVRCFEATLYLENSKIKEEPKEWVRAKGYFAELIKGEFYKIDLGVESQYVYFVIELGLAYFKTLFEEPVTKSEMEQILKDEAKLKEDKDQKNDEINNYELIKKLEKQNKMITTILELQAQNINIMSERISFLQKLITQC